MLCTAKPYENKLIISTKGLTPLGHLQEGIPNTEFDSFALYRLLSMKMLQEK
jgi:hypothetical protein